jgi:hypothetical protein
MSDHEDAAARLEREADDMQRHSDEVKQQIDDARSDWARKQADSAVPGAVGEPADQDAREPWPDE